MLFGVRKYKYSNQACWWQHHHCRQKAGKKKKKKETTWANCLMLAYLLN